MTGSDVRSVYEKILPREALESILKAARFQKRQRKLDAVLLVRSMIIAASTGCGGRQAEVMRLYFQAGAERVVRGGFYAWFGKELEEVTEGVRDRALAYVAEQPVDLPGFLGEHVSDWHAFDSETVKLDGALQNDYPGAGNYAALKIHKRFSVGVGTTIDYHISPAREHDSKHLTIDESWRGLGVLADLGYASHANLRACDRYGAKYVIRLKNGWKPRVVRVNRGELTHELLEGSDLDAVLDGETWLIDGKAVDLVVEFGKGEKTFTARLVGVPAEIGYRFYLTNLPVSVGPHQVSDLYRVRWEIELDNKLDKSCHRLEEIGARTGPSVRAMVHSAMTASIMVCLLAHHHRIGETQPRAPGEDRTTAPIHPQTLARATGQFAQRIAAALQLEGAAAKSEWAAIADYLTHLGKDPNWRSRPSILDQLRGWRITPGRPRKQRASSVRRTATRTGAAAAG